MHKVEIAETLDILQYEKQRQAYRKSIIELKKRRRIAVGPSVTFVFENRATVLSQVQEMMRAERIVELDALQHELDTYNELLPGVDQLAATMFIELEQSVDIREQISRFHGVNTDSVTYFEIDGEQAPGIFASGQSDESRISAVQYVKFQLSPQQRESFLGSTQEVWLVIDHSNYSHRAQPTTEVREELKRDLQAA
ncbi:MAG: DUF3501 family protein [Acidobacteriota bacterium]